jgi:hypothetical protein
MQLCTRLARNSRRQLVVVGRFSPRHRLIARALVALTRRCLRMQTVSTSNKHARLSSQCSIELRMHSRFELPRGPFINAGLLDANAHPSQDALSRSTPHHEFMCRGAGRAVGGVARWGLGGREWKSRSDVPQSRTVGVVESRAGMCRGIDIHARYELRRARIRATGARRFHRRDARRTAGGIQHFRLRILPMAAVSRLSRGGLRKEYRFGRVLRTR